jgi:Rrf2 family transcriptional regulator, cysteine metabolism repressor
MMAISTRGRYSLQILTLMAAQPQGCIFTKHQIARSEAVPLAYIQQLMTTLRTAGFVNSHRGKTGGFTLARAAATITVADVLRATEGQMAPAPCLGSQRCEREERCVLRPLWVRATTMIEDLFGGVTLAELVESGADGLQADGTLVDGPGVDSPLFEQRNSLSIISKVTL